MSGPFTRRVLGTLFLGAAALTVGAVCVDPSTGATRTAQPVHQPMVNPPREGPGNIEVLQVDVVNGRFGHRAYHVQSGAIQLRFVARGTGPHAVMIENVMQARLLPVGEESVFHFTASPGEYRMLLDGGAQDVAVLNVRPVGGR
jgi:hypothetical protein